MNDTRLPVVTRSRLVADLQKLGLVPGQVVMLHVSVKSVGWVVGGPDTMIQALLDVLTATGTLMMYIGWEEAPYNLAEWPKKKRQAYLEECPPFNPATSRAYHKWSILTEYLRTWPGAYRSSHPEASVAAIGSLARWITGNHPLQYGYGPGSPFAKLYESGGKVLLVGAPLNAITLLHFAEHLARVPNKRVVRYKMPVLRNGKRVWVDIEEYDTSQGIVDWQGEDYFALIGREYLSGRGRSGKVGAAQSYLLDAAELVEFAIHWMEHTFKEQTNGR